MKKALYFIFTFSLVTLTFCEINPNKDLYDLSSCKDNFKIKSVPGPEDFEFLEQENIIIAASLDRRKLNITGKLYMIDLSKPSHKQKAISISSNYPANFYPLGITSQRVNNKVFLYVISKGKSKRTNSIEKFEFSKQDSLVKCNHIQTLIDNEKLISPNDLVALPDGKLFIANDFEKLGGNLSMFIDIVFKRKRAPIIYYDKEKFHETNIKNTFTSGISYINNVNCEYIFCSDFFNKSIQRFSLNWNNSNLPVLQLDTTINLNSGPDNLTIDSKQNLYVAAHPSLRLMLKHEKDSSFISPTQIFKINSKAEVSLLYSDDGNDISTGTVAAFIKNRLYIGQLCEDFVFSCPIIKE
jgi:hypothetical protein